MPTIEQISEAHPLSVGLAKAAGKKTKLRYSIAGAPYVSTSARVVKLAPSQLKSSTTAVRFVLAADLVNDLVAAAARNTLHKRLAAWSAPELLLIDELGYLSFDARGADLLYQVFNRRYQRTSTIVTTNLPFKDWGTLFHNSAAASAIADRLVHKGLLVQITGKSRRSDREVES